MSIFKVNHSLQEICQRPRFIGEPDGENTRFSVEAGELGDQWLLAAVASLALTPKFLERVVPPDQGFETTNSYCGAFRSVKTFTYD